MSQRVITFTKVKLPYGWLGNMAPYPILHEKKEWRTSEALFQAMRFDDQGICDAIREAKSPMNAKMIAKAYTHRMVVAPRSIEDVKNMQTVLLFKLAQHASLTRELLDTEDATIIEDSTNRQNESGLFWGAALKDGEWIGDNTLGKLWMQIRDYARNHLPDGL